METTHGPLEVQLWCRECPTTVNFFLQLCLDGFYDGMLFHRIVPKFLIQTGAVRHQRGSSDASQDEAMLGYRKVVQADYALERRRYEVHSRLRFSHRGIVAMALAVQDDENVELMQPQFFMTLDEANFLDSKHVVFGTCVGPTFFNALRISQVEVDEHSNEPVDLEHAPRITGVRILENPIALVPQSNVPWKTLEASSTQHQKKKKRKGKLDKNVLSFGHEVEQDVLLVPVKKKDVTANDEGDKTVVSGNNAEDGTQLPSSDVPTGGGAQEAADELVDGKPSTLQTRLSGANEMPDEGVQKPDYDEDKNNPPLNRASVSGERDGERRILDAPHRAHSPQDVQKVSCVSLVETRKARYTQRSRVTGSADDKRQREEETMARLLAFQSNLKSSKRQSAVVGDAGSLEDNGLASRMARRFQQQEERHSDIEEKTPTYHGQILVDDDKGDDERVEARSRDWMLTKFQCRKHMDLADGLGGDGRLADDYQVLDDRRRHRHHGASRGKRHSEEHSSKRHKSHQHHHDRLA
jgi:peptidyl-prolyl cis-trans isomerase SDCCAG10